MRFKLEIELGQIEGLRTGKNLADTLHRVASLFWTASEPLYPLRYGITDERTMGTCGHWEVIEDPKPEPDPAAPPTVEEWNTVSELYAPYLLMDDSDDSSHGTFDTVDEAKGAAIFDRLVKWTIYRAGQIVETEAK